MKLDNIASPLLKNGQTIAHIYKTRDLKCSKSTLYNYINQKKLTVRNIDLPKRVRYSKKSQKRQKPKTLHFLLKNIKKESPKTLQINVYRPSYMVRETGIEPVRVISPQDFKSCASACSATRACILWNISK